MKLHKTHSQYAIFSLYWHDLDLCLVTKVPYSSWNELICLWMAVYADNNGFLVGKYSVSLLNGISPGKDRSPHLLNTHAKQFRDQDHSIFISWKHGSTSPCLCIWKKIIRWKWKGMTFNEGTNGNVPFPPNTLRVSTTTNACVLEEPWKRLFVKIAKFGLRFRHYLFSKW